MSSTAQNISQKAGELTGQAQMKKDEMMNQASQGANSQSSDQTLTSQATQFLQQTGEQMKNMAQGAADVVKNTLGMNENSDSNAPSGEGSGTNMNMMNTTSSAPSATNMSTNMNMMNTASSAPSTNHPSNPSPRT